ncbi:hypothetical protein [Kitasatospora cathayae]|uniref:Uncharacterized protein n=1 Tax=Kitasatospora cathayae TaxID=3004092 RepID=A0ABY7QJC9_9ACTN|nr:hypothetical protein [Kitasatospora sp. HUAS 3-15]WBP92004.1 hypothetical protein O1G21_40165 [Kitasatospora sp. HUAS 3-15]
MTETLRTRAIRAALDTADNIAIAAAAAAAGLTTYRALAARPTETRFTLAAAAAGLAACLADQATTQLRRPLRHRLGVPAYSYALAAAAPAPAPSREQLAAEVAADAAHRAATGAHGLDRSGGSLTEADNWLGSEDGTATCELPGGAHLLCVPAPADQYGHSTRTYLLVRDGERIRVSSISELVALLDAPATDSVQPTDNDDQADDPWAALGRDLAIAELCPGEPFDGDDQADEDDVDQEADAHSAGLL